MKADADRIDLSKVAPAKRKHLTVGDDGFLVLKVRENLIWTRARDARALVSKALNVNLDLGAEIIRGRLASGQIMASAGACHGSFTPRERVKLSDGRDWIGAELWPYFRITEAFWVSGDLQATIVSGDRNISYSDIRFLHENVLALCNEVAAQPHGAQPLAQPSPPSKFTVEGAMARGVSGKFIRSDFALILEIHSAVHAGTSSASGAAHSLADRAAGDGTLYAKGKRLERLYLAWERLGE